MKKSSILSFVLIVISSLSLQAQLPDYYKKYYVVRSVYSSGRAWDQNVNNVNNVSLYSYNGNSNQQWIIMPTYLKADNGIITASNDYIIASRYDGDVMGITSGNNINTYNNFDGNNNKIFRFTIQTSPDIFFINSPHNTNRYLDMDLNGSNWGSLIYYTYNGNSNQRFKLVTHSDFSFQFPTIRNIVRTTIPAPPAPTSFNASIVTETPKVFKSETLIPFAMVKNDAAPAWQVDYSPFYRLVRSQYYKLPEDNDSDITYMPGELESRTLTTKKGMKSTSVTEVSSKLTVSFTASAEVGFKVVSLLSAKASASISTGLELFTKTVDTFEETNETSLSITYSFTAPVQVRLITYQLIDYYQLFRQDGTLVLDWEVMTPLAHRVQYPSEEDYGGRTSEGTSFTMEDGDIIPIYKSRNSSEIFDEDSIKKDITSDKLFSAKISPNPVTDKLKLIYNPLPKGTEISVFIYSTEGRLYKKVKLHASSDGNFIDISGFSSGLYFVKIVTGKYSNVLKIIKQ